MEKEILFGICADVHHSARNNMTGRMATFVDEANARKADFIIELGDFCTPCPEAEPLMAQWNRFQGPSYHVLGNHDTEHAGKRAMMAFTGQKEKYYSFDVGNYHFVVLDTNYFKVGPEYFDYDKDNYHQDFSNCYIPKFQLDWLEADLNATDKRCFLFTHATLELGDWCVYNIHEFGDRIWRINEKAGFNKVTMILSGHDHADAHLFKGGIHYLLINSMSHKYIGPDCFHLSSHCAEATAGHPELNGMVPYKEPLYAFIRLKPNGLIQVIGKQTEYDGPSPVELHWPYYTSPQISYREMWMNGHGEL